MRLEHSRSKPARSGGKVYLTSRQVRARYGDCSDMTLWRWQNDPNLGFPAPLKINQRRLWDLDTLIEFEAQHAESVEAST